MAMLPERRPQAQQIHRHEFDREENGSEGGDQHHELGSEDEQKNILEVWKNGVEYFLLVLRFSSQQETDPGGLPLLLHAPEPIRRFLR